MLPDYTYHLDQDDIDSAPAVTIGQFRALALAREWSEDWLVEQCRGEMDDARTTVRDILAGRGLTKPWFTGSSDRPTLVNLDETALVWAPLLALYHTHRLVCECGCKAPLCGKQRYASPACRQRASRRSRQPV
jgi:hypothetical protein